MKIIQKPWGHEEIWAETDHYVGKVLHINQGYRLSLQYHERKTETIRVLSGVLTFTLGKSTPQGWDLKEVKLNPGDIYHILPETIHRMGCGQDETVPCEVLEVSTPELDDVVRLEDDYKRS